MRQIYAKEGHNITERVALGLVGVSLLKSRKTSKVMKMYFSQVLEGECERYDSRKGGSIGNGRNRSLRRICAKAKGHLSNICVCITHIYKEIDGCIKEMGA